MSDALLKDESYILFELAGTTYGLSSQDVQHMEILEHITPVPSSPPYVEGVAYSRGQVLPAVNLRVKFGLPRQKPTLSSRLIVVQSGSRHVGLIVDSAREFRTIPRASILPPDQTVAVSGTYLQGIAPLGDRLIFLLNVAELLRVAETEDQQAAREPAVPL